MTLFLIGSLAFFIICAFLGYKSVSTKIEVPDDYKEIAKQNNGFAVQHGMVWSDDFKNVIGDKKLVRSSFKPN